ncbi:MAG: type II secretion system protein GspJ [Bdellovibrionales bacterium]
MNSRGFTLIEVIIAMVILSFLSLFTVESIQRALQTKTKVQKDIDKNATVRDALRIMERDINMAFNYRDINIQLWNDSVKARQKKATTGTTSPGATGAPPPTLDPNSPMNKPKVEKIFTQFIGEAASLDFTSLSNVRMMEGSAMSQQAEIGYKIKPCRRRSTQTQSSQCLWRRVDNYFHDDITKDGQETVLLENVKEFKLRYLGPGRDDEWVDTWITNERGDDQTKGRFPYAVEITIEVKDDSPNSKDKTLRLTSVASIRNPNNPPDLNDPNDPNNPNNPNSPNFNGGAGAAGGTGQGGGTTGQGGQGGTTTPPR